MSVAEGPIVQEARRIMEVCNACRYCEGFCAVFPAMEMRRSFTTGDLEYLANLCHNCTGCFHACQYAPPHEFDINNSRVMARLRAGTYEKYAWPGSFARLFRRNGTVISVATAMATALLLMLALTVQGKDIVLSLHQGGGSFYSVVPYHLMLGVPLVMVILTTAVIVVSLVRFARGTGWDVKQLLDPELMWLAARDVLTLRYLGGSGDGCNYEDDTYSHKRRWYHQILFYGFGLCVLSTTAAAVYEHFLHWQAPYPITSFPVVTGTLGGVGILLGSAGLFWLKVKRDPRPQAESLLGMDVAFSGLLFLTSMSGLLLLSLRETRAMGVLLILHLGFVAGFFITLPYGKFVHAVYRFAALVRFADEKRRNPPGNGIL